MRKRVLAGLIAGVVLAGAFGSSASYADGTKVVTLGANLSEEQRAEILNFFGVREDEVEILTITNEDERERLGGLVPPEQIGTRTFSCALVNPTNQGGIQVKTANMNYVTSNMIASTLSTSGVVNCDVLTAAPFEVSGTGALTGVMMAYETASGETLDEDKKQLANKELVTTGTIANTVGQDEATHIVNDVKIEVIRDGIEEREEVAGVVDTVVEDIHAVSAARAQERGEPEPPTLSSEEKELVTDLGYDIGQMHYHYEDVRETLERVDMNVSGDPQAAESEALAQDSILMNSNDAALGEDVIINATNESALQGTAQDAPQPPAQPETEPAAPAGDTIHSETASLIPLGESGATGFISGTDMTYVSPGNDYTYALADMYGNPVTEAKYTSGFSVDHGLLSAKEERDGMNRCGILSQNGSVLVPFNYADTSVKSGHWVLGILVKDATADNYDYESYSDDHYYLIDTVDIYYIGDEDGTLVGTIDRAHYKTAYAVGEYLQIEDRSNGVVTRYDSSFSQVATDLNGIYDTSGIETEEYVIYNENGQDGIKDLDGNVVVAPCFKDISAIYHGYAKIYNGEAYGLMDLMGNVVVQPVYDTVRPNYYGPILDLRTGDSTCYDAAGYFAVVREDRLGYVDYNGVETCAPKYLEDQMDVYGASATIKDLDGALRVLAADGVETVLPDSYTSVRAVDRSSGLLYAVADDSYTYSLIDWHGKEILPMEYNRLSISGDGRYLLASKSGETATLYEIDYAVTGIDQKKGHTTGTDAAQPAEPAQDAAQPPAETSDQSAAQPPAGDASGQSTGDGSGEDVKGTLESAAILAETDVKGNKVAIQALIDQANASIDGNSPAAATLQSVQIMLDSDTEDGAGVAALLRAAENQV